MAVQEAYERERAFQLQAATAVEFAGYFGEQEQAHAVSTHPGNRAVHETLGRPPNPNSSPEQGPRLPDESPFSRKLRELYQDQSFHVPRLVDVAADPSILARTPPSTPPAPRVPPPSMPQAPQSGENTWGSPPNRPPFDYVLFGGPPDTGKSRARCSTPDPGNTPDLLL